MIPVASTTISVYAIAETEPGEGRTSTLRASGVRAVIGSLTGSETSRPGGGEATVTARLDCDPTTSLGQTLTLDHTDLVKDETTGQTFEVQWAHAKGGLGLDHIEGSLVLVTGVANG
jgi:hypothetical protein